MPATWPNTLARSICTEIFQIVTAGDVFGGKMEIEICNNISIVRYNVLEALKWGGRPVKQSGVTYTQHKTFNKQKCFGYSSITTTGRPVGVGLANLRGRRRLWWRWLITVRIGRIVARQVDAGLFHLACDIVEQVRIFAAHLHRQASTSL